MQLNLIRTDAQHPDFIWLVKQLDADLALKDGEEHQFYSAYNSSSNIKQVVLAYLGNDAIACGAIKPYAPGIMEVKRMFTVPAHRGHGVAGQVLASLEEWARELNCHACVLETGRRQPEAIALYTRKGYKQIPNYGQYAGVANSVCFEKRFIAGEEKA